MCRPWITVGFLACQAVALSAATVSWTGLGADNRWTTAANWTGGAPAAGDDLVFPAGTAQRDNWNDFSAGTRFRSIELKTQAMEPYTIWGNTILLDAGITDRSIGATNYLDVPITLTSDQVIAVAATGLGLRAGIDLGGRSLTVVIAGSGILGVGPISGTGRITKSDHGYFEFAGPSSYLGQMTIHDGMNSVAGDMSLGIADGTVGNGTVLADGAVLGLDNSDQGNEQITLKGGSIAGQGILGSIEAQTPMGIAWDSRIGPFSTDRNGYRTSGIITLLGQLRLDSRSFLDLYILGATPGSGGYSQLVVRGDDVSLGQASLTTTGGDYVPNFGDVLTIIQNDGIGPIIGEFKGLQEGARVTVVNSMGNGWDFRISYMGGDGNDVTLTYLGW